MGCEYGDYQWNNRHDLQPGCCMHPGADGDFSVAGGRESGTQKQRQPVPGYKFRRILLPSCIVGGGAGDHQWNEFHDLQSGCHHNTWPDSDVPVSECRFSSVWHRKRF